MKLTTLNVGSVSIHNVMRRGRALIRLGITLLEGDTDIARVPRAELEQLVDRLNRTPRKCLAYRTPSEVLAEQVALELEAER